jgi:hypothetical protein
MNRLLCNRVKLAIDDAQRTDLVIQRAQGRLLTYRSVGGKRTVVPAAKPPVSPSWQRMSDDDDPRQMELPLAKPDASA